MKIVPKSWDSFQHYKDRSPSWIKLHKALLDNFEFQCLPVASRALAPMLWLLASEYEAGEIDATAAKLCFRLRMSEKELIEALNPLILAGFFTTDDGDSRTLAECKRDAIPRREEKRREEDVASAPEGQFPDFWNAWPASDRKQDRKKCLAKWVKMGFDRCASDIIAHVEIQKRTKKWIDGYDPAPLTYLNGERWKDGSSPSRNPAFEGGI